MTDSKNPTRRPLTDEELDDLSVITPDDVDRAVAFWKQHVSPKYAGLLDAEPYKPPVRDKGKKKRSPQGR